jgi:hypothetical protein
MGSSPLARTAGYTPLRIEARIRAFESFGIHRTGWPADDQTSDWLIEELAAAGVTAEAERFSFPRFEVKQARVRLGDEVFAGLPLHDAGVTDPGGIDGEICDDSDEDVFGKVVLATSAQRRDSAWSGPALDERIEELTDRGAIGILIPSGDRDGELVARNAARIDRPHVLPVLQVKPAAARALQAATVIRGEVVLEIDADRLRSNASNVIATIEGSRPELPPIGIVTPKSGWFTCAAERGGGIAIFLALAESLASAAPLERTVHLLASSGHELNFFGIRSYARIHRDRIVDASAWLHLGASIGAREPRAATAASDDALHELTATAGARAGIAPDEVRPPGPSRGGEALVISELGTRYVSFLGGHAYFHSPNDTVDRAVDAESVSRWAHASLEVLNGLLELRSEGE